MEQTDVAVIGAGFAGMTAAIYAARAGAVVTVIERGTFGGQILTAGRIENYPGCPGITGGELSATVEEQMRATGARVLRKEVAGAERKSDGIRLLIGEEELFCRSVILATGAKRRRLGIPGEDRFAGQGVSWCATCDGNFFRGKVVAVAGGGNTAFGEAIDLCALCRKVYLLWRSQEPRADRILQERARQLPNLVQMPGSRILEVCGEAFVTHLRVECGGQVLMLEADGLFEAVGTIPDTAPFSGLLPLAPDGGFLTDRECRTAVPGVFAVGDCRSGAVRQLVTAAADGAIAGILASR